MESIFASLSPVPVEFAGTAFIPPEGIVTFETSPLVVLNLLFGIATSIMLPSIYFAIQKTYINYKREKI